VVGARTRLERSAQRDLGLAVAHVAADQAVHGALLLHVGLDPLDRLALVGRLLPGELRLELAQPLGVLRVAEARAPLALRVEVDELAGQLLGGAPGAGLQRLPRLAAELGQRRMAAARADVAADLRQLVDRHEHLVRAGELELEVVARDAADGLGVEAGEAREAVVLVDDDVARAQVGERAQGAAPPASEVHAAGPLGALAAEQAMLGQDGELEARRDEPVAQVGLGELQRFFGLGV
jgi:hypothetical protein